MKTISVLGVPVASISKTKALNKIERFVASTEPHHITTVNPEFLVIAQKNFGFLRVLLSSDLSLADGVGLQLAANLNGKSFASRLPGRVMVEEIAKLAGRHHWKLFFLGSEPGIAQKAAESLAAKYSGFDFKTSFDDPTADGTQKSIKDIKRFKPDILFVAYGAPQQDIWISDHKELLNVPVMMGVGGAFDYIAGKSKTPPEYVSKYGLEWLWRLVHEPRRIVRQATRLPTFIALVIIDWFKKSDTNP